jgi:hypothetical protein
MAVSMNEIWKLEYTVMVRGSLNQYCTSRHFEWCLDLRYD